MGGESQETSISVVVEWYLETDGGNSPVTYNITSCPKSEGDCIQNPLFESFESEGILMETVEGLEPSTDYEITIRSNTTRVWVDGALEPLESEEDVVYHASTRG